MKTRTTNQNSKQLQTNLLVQKQNLIINVLRKITAQDTFPCYSCFDQFDSRINCIVCHQQGFIMGNHPMVRFIDDFLTKNLPKQLVSQIPFNDDLIKDSQMNSQELYDGKSLVFVKNKLEPRECRSAVQSYGYKKMESSNDKQIFPINLMKSSNPITKQEIHFSYCCNSCECQPIIGKRFHCEECQNFDLCQNCHKSGVQINEHKAFHKMTIVGITRLKPEMLEKLKKSTVYKKQKR